MSHDHNECKRANKGKRDITKHLFWTMKGKENCKRAVYKQIRIAKCMPSLLKSCAEAMSKE